MPSSYPVVPLLARALMPVIALGLCSAANAGQLDRVFCAQDADCPAFQTSSGRCVEGICRPACTFDADCGPGLLCMHGGCFPGVVVELPVDYGLTPEDERQPGCRLAEERRNAIVFHDVGHCSPDALCIESRCVLAPSHGCSRDADCPPLGGAVCEGGQCVLPVSCELHRECRDSYPIAGLRCIDGRCSSYCQDDSDCCDPGSARCDTRPQGRCWHPDGDLPRCVRDLGSARMVALHLSSPDIASAPTFVFLSEGWQLGQMVTFETMALRHARWLTTYADITNALFRDGYNLFMLALPDRASGYGAGTMAGWVLEDRIPWQMAGGGDHALLLVETALAAFGRSAGADFGRDAIENTKVVHLFNASSGRALGGPWIFMARTDVADFTFPSGWWVPFDLSRAINDDYYVMHHEFGHSLSADRVFLRDEYVNRTPRRRAARDEDFLNDLTRRARAAPNLVARDQVTDCTECDGSDDAPFPGAETDFSPDRAPWGSYVNLRPEALPYSWMVVHDKLDKVGLYEGAMQGLRYGALRSQVDCVMRQGGLTEHFCTACTHAFKEQAGADGRAGLFRLLDLERPILLPHPLGAPRKGIVVNPRTHRAYMTRLGPDDNGVGTEVLLTIVDGSVLTRFASRDFSVDAHAGAAGEPLDIVVDEMEEDTVYLSFIPFDTSESLLLRVERWRSLQNGRWEIVYRKPIPVPGMFGAMTYEREAGAAGRIFAFRSHVDDQGPELQLVTFELAEGEDITPRFSVPTERQEIPGFIGAGLRAERSGLLVFKAAMASPPRPACNHEQCELWLFDPHEERFLDDSVLTVAANGALDARIWAADVGTVQPHAGTPPREVLAAATENRVYVWDLAQVLQGDTAPEATWEHTLGETHPVSHIAILTKPERVLLVNRRGEMESFRLDGSQGIGDGLITIPEAEPWMRPFTVLATPEGAVYIAMGGFHPNPRNGLIAALDLSGYHSGEDRIRSVHPIDAIALGGPALALDEERGTLFTTAVVDSGDRISGAAGAPFRMPLIRALGMESPPGP